MADEVSGVILDKDGNIKKETLAHEVNKELLDIILYRQQRKFLLSAGLIGIKLAIVLGILLMVAFQKTLDDAWKEVMLVILGGFVGSIGKLVDFWFNSQSDDQQLVESAQDYRMGVNGNDKK
tara:strand:+ start:7330 stop:7695 length:366 start_codon:yes stop_codon:yes gene_type:complete